jgi:hypothetical protein
MTPTGRDVGGQGSTFIIDGTANGDIPDFTLRQY